MIYFCYKKYFALTWLGVAVLPAAQLSSTARVGVRRATESS